MIVPLKDYADAGFEQLRQSFAERRKSHGPPALSVRRAYWSSLPDIERSGEEARAALIGYARAIEEEIGARVGRRSIAYWLHASRRIPIFAPNADPISVGNLRMSLECAYQKYGLLGPCSGVAWSDEILPDRILNGLFVRFSSLSDQRAIHRARQLVLTDFSLDDFSELWLLDRLSNELNRCSGALRNVAYGGKIANRPKGEGFDEHLSPEVARLCDHHNRRRGRFEASTTGTAIGPDDDSVGQYLVANYNARTVDLNYFRKMTGITFVPRGRPPNFVWAPFPFRAVYQTHQPFEPDFTAVKGASLLDVMTSVLGLLIDATARWDSSPQQLGRHWQFAMDEGVTWASLPSRVREKSSIASDILGAVKTGGDYESALVNLLLTPAKRSVMEPLLGSPLFALLPFGENFLVDYAWIGQIVSHMFFDVRPANQNFKGEALENAVNAHSRSVLPRTPCRAHDDTARQFDASFESGNVLIAVECRSFWRSVAYDRGEERAQSMRDEKLDIALADITGKAEWLAQRPTGRNYSLSATIEWICPIVVTPFVEFIPSQRQMYWLTEHLARVMTPNELATAMKDGAFSDQCQNLVRIHRSSN